MPEQESFGGQGSQYLRLLAAVSAFFLLGFTLITSRGRAFQTALLQLYHSGWIWLYGAAFLIPIGIGLRYWFLLREEEITVTDEYIARRSHWGDEKLAWRDVREYRRQPILFRHTRLGRIAWLSRFFADKQLLVDLGLLSYELFGPPDANGNARCMCLEAGTIDDLPWLLELVEERLGPPA